MDLALKVLLNWTPMIILIAIFFYAMYGKRQTNIMKAYVPHMKNLENTMERIAVALEKLTDKVK
jgi:hypothetical protein